jgi:sterol desaturase/sphingolipid hydroxylase (fatty acid hydroxylase superfamily)
MDAAPVDLRPWLLGLLAFVLGAAVLEGLVRSVVLRLGYDWRAFATSMADAAGRRAVDALGFSIALPVLTFAHEHRVADLALATPPAFALLFIGQEFCYYGYHRCAHRTAWFWASHCVHHTPRELTLAAALRLGWTGKLTGTALFFAPLAWLGFPVNAVLATLALNLLYQFWLHAPWLPRLGPLEWVLNTPAHHSVHHASNPEYLDCNYGGMLIVFDRWFGTFVEKRDDITIRYGLTEPLDTHNPLRLNAHGWLQLGRRWRAARGWRGGWHAVFGPPGEPG